MARELKRNKKCAQDGCDKLVGKYGARGLCKKHYDAWRNRHGARGECSVDGCHKPALGLGLCDTHRYRLKANGDPSVVKAHKTGLSRKFPSEYHTWKHMIQRCYNKKNKAYRYYGARGIKVCDEWLGVDGSLTFIKDMGEKPEPKNIYSIDRIDVNGDYCPGNCRWATAYQQVHNRRCSIKN